MSEMIERVARALCIADFNDPDRILYGAGEGYTDMLQWKYQYPAKARAAIEAMLEPTEAMLEIGAAADSESGSTGNQEIVYFAMIDAALEDDK